MDRVPFAASVRGPGPGQDRESFDLADAEDPMQFPQSDADELARRERLAALPAPRPVITCEERDNLVAACAQAVVAWRGVHGAADVLIRFLSDRLNVSAEEAERLIDAEIRRRVAGNK